MTAPALRTIQVAAVPRRGDFFRTQQEFTDDAALWETVAVDEDGQQPPDVGGGVFLLGISESFTPEADACVLWPHS
jgi:hypothetical protein